MAVDRLVKTIRRFRISASRRLFHPDWSAERNEALFGRRSSELGYGANFTIFVAVESRIDPATGMTIHTDRIKDAVDPVLSAFDHRHMTIETDHFARVPATTESLSSVLFDLIAPRLPAQVTLANVVVWDSRTRWADRAPGRVRSGVLHDVYWRRPGQELSIPSVHSTLAVVRSGDVLGIEAKGIDDVCAAFAPELEMSSSSGAAAELLGAALISLRGKLMAACARPGVDSRIDGVTLSDALLGSLSVDPCGVLRLSRHYEFEATHRMYNAKLSEAENRALFGKGTNPFGHGHSFLVRVSARLAGPRAEEALPLARAMDDAARDVTGRLERRRLELEVPFFQENVATTENVSRWIWSELRELLGPRIDGLTVWGTENNVYEIAGDDSAALPLRREPLTAGHRPEIWS